MSCQKNLENDFQNKFDIINSRLSNLEIANSKLNSIIDDLLMKIEVIEYENKILKTKSNMIKQRKLSVLTVKDLENNITDESDFERIHSVDSIRSDDSDAHSSDIGFLSGHYPSRDETYDPEEDEEYEIESETEDRKESETETEDTTKECIERENEQQSDVEMLSQSIQTINL